MTLSLTSQLTLRPSPRPFVQFLKLGIDVFHLLRPCQVQRESVEDLEDLQQIKDSTTSTTSTTSTEISEISLRNLRPSHSDLRPVRLAAYCVCELGFVCAPAFHCLKQGCNWQLRCVDSVWTPAIFKCSRLGSSGPLSWPHSLLQDQRVFPLPSSVTQLRCWMIWSTKSFLKCICVVRNGQLSVVLLVSPPPACKEVLSGSPSKSWCRMFRTWCARPNLSQTFVDKPPWLLFAHQSSAAKSLGWADPRPYQGRPLLCSGSWLELLQDSSLATLRPESMQQILSNVTCLYVFYFQMLQGKHMKSRTCAINETVLKCASCWAKSISIKLFHMSSVRHWNEHRMNNLTESALDTDCPN